MADCEKGSWKVLASEHLSLMLAPLWRYFCEGADL